MVRAGASRAVSASEMLSVAGEFPPRWLSSLASRLAALRIDIRSLNGAQNAKGHWHVAVEVAASKGLTSQEIGVFATSGTNSVPPPGRALSLRNFRVERRDDCLELVL